MTHESREATKGEFLASLSSPTRNFHARSRSLMIRFQPKKEQAKIQTVLQSNGRAIRAERERGRGGSSLPPPARYLALKHAPDFPRPIPLPLLAPAAQAKGSRNRNSTVTILY